MPPFLDPQEPAPAVAARLPSVQPNVGHVPAGLGRGAAGQDHHQGADDDDGVGAGGRGHGDEGGEEQEEEEKLI